jgi:hypothetical protein
VKYHLLPAHQLQHVFEAHKEQLLVNQFLKLFQFPESLEALGSPQKQIVVFAVMADRQGTRKRAYQLPGHS